MPDWVAQAAELIVLVVIMLERRRTGKDVGAVREVVTNSMRPPPPRCGHDGALVVAEDVETDSLVLARLPAKLINRHSVLWCQHCGSVRTEGAWHVPGDRETPVRLHGDAHGE